MNIEFIEWMCNISVAFEFFKDDVGEAIVYNGVRYNRSQWTDENIAIRLLVHEAIDGWNDSNTSDSRYILQDYDSVLIMDATDFPHKEESRHETDDLHYTRISALNYVYETKS